MAGGVDLVDLALALVGKQALAHAAIESVQLLLARRRNGPRFGCREGLRRKQRGWRGQDVQAQRWEVERVGVELEEAGAGGLDAAGVLVMV